MADVNDVLKIPQCDDCPCPHSGAEECGHTYTLAMMKETPCARADWWERTRKERMH